MIRLSGWFGLGILLFLSLGLVNVVLADDSLLLQRGKDFSNQVVFWELGEGGRHHFNCIGGEAADIDFAKEKYVVQVQGRLILFNFRDWEKDLTHGDWVEKKSDGEYGIELTGEANIMPALDNDAKRVAYAKIKYFDWDMSVGSIYYLNVFDNKGTCLRKEGYTNPVWWSDNCLMALKKVDNVLVPRLLYLDGREDVEILTEDALLKDGVTCSLSKNCSNDKQFFVRKKKVDIFANLNWLDRYQIVLMNKEGLIFIKEFPGAVDAMWMGESLVTVNKSGRGDSVSIFDKNGELIKTHYFGQCGVHKEIFQIVAIIGKKIYIDDGENFLYLFDADEGKKDVYRTENMFQ